MAVSGNVSIAQDGGPAKLHPYLVALVRWCVSCLWSTATVLLHRITIKPVPQITGLTSKLSKPRPAGREHLHPEPKVECVVLHQPEVHNIDVVFVHGLYGSLCNTWRQGEWRSKYQSSPEKVHLRRPAASPSPCSCLPCDKQTDKTYSDTEKRFNEDNNFKQDRNIFDDETNIVYYLEKENKCVFEDKTCDNRLNKNNNYKSQFNDESNITDSYDGHEAFKNIDDNFYEGFRKMLPEDDAFITEKFYNNTLLDQVEIIENYETQAQFVSDLFKNCDNSCDPDNERTKLEHSNENYQNNNGQNTNSIHFPENCMCIDKECEVGCGCNCDNCYSPCWPKDWIKVDYPDARVISINYTSDPHLWRPIWIKENKRLCLYKRAEQMTEQLLELKVGDRPVVWVGHSKGGLFIKQIYCEAYEAYQKVSLDKTKQSQEDKMTKMQNNDSITEEIIKKDENYSIVHESGNEQIKNSNMKQKSDDKGNPMSLRVEDNLLSRRNEGQSLSADENEDLLCRRASLWSNSGAFMFYSVPHRGSPLADIKIPIAARSIELMEISKDNSLVLSLQERWLQATSFSKPLVRSLVETRRTLMSILWLRIVSTDSADPGIGALCGVSVDHREICKPSSRRCFLYTELAALIKAGLNRFKTAS